MDNILTWRDVVGHESLFMVSSNGEVLSKRTNKILKQHTSRKGYRTIATKIGGRQGVNFCFKVHRLVASAFLPNPENKPYVNHVDGDKLNNSLANLEWCTAQENMLHAISIGLVNLDIIRNESKKNRKLNPEQVIFIREHYRSSGKRGCH